MGQNRVTYRGEGSGKIDNCNDGNDPHDDGFIVGHICQVQGGFGGLSLEMLEDLY
jgi:hypothetical protein